MVLSVLGIWTKGTIAEHWTSECNVSDVASELSVLVSSRSVLVSVNLSLHWGLFNPKSVNWRRFVLEIGQHFFDLLLWILLHEKVFILVLLWKFVIFVLKAIFETLLELVSLELHWRLEGADHDVIWTSSMMSILLALIVLLRVHVRSLTIRAYCLRVPCWAQVGILGVLSREVLGFELVVKFVQLEVVLLLSDIVKVLYWISRSAKLDEHLCSFTNCRIPVVLQIEDFLPDCKWHEWWVFLENSQMVCYFDLVLHHCFTFTLSIPVVIVITVEDRSLVRNEVLVELRDPVSDWVTVTATFVLVLDAC